MKPKLKISYAQLKILLQHIDSVLPEKYREQLRKKLYAYVTSGKYEKSQSVPFIDLYELILKFLLAYIKGELDK